MILIIDIVPPQCVELPIDVELNCVRTASDLLTVAFSFVENKRLFCVIALALVSLKII